ncbi:MAG: sugar ABC transporter permease [Anaerolineae bacterium]|jgi:multiple sugar transport system permease protein|uniref:carbohydrate ABC transporter permease n=1 Tax=Candidatus Flexifilum breve TaxID=3140694 RepID=UPI001AC69D5A|nr:sugar ABC transporter permease [Chloroflexota bacterium]MBK9749376.1 sugar ABC transporter permease [Chloroflexota bacterium]MBN8639066.1 sugar ABC transporter permease [Anaerolineae bacterium]
MTDQAVVTRLSRRERRVTPQQRELFAGLAFISPWIVGFLIFTAGPMAVSLGLSFTDYDVLSPPEFVGFENYQRLLSDPRLGLSLANSFIYALFHVPLAILVAMGLALLLNRVGKAAGFFRTAYYLPSITPAVAVATLWLWLLNPRIGLVNQGLALLGIQGPGWTTDPAWIKPGIVLMSLWNVGGTVILYLAALRNVPPELYEAARIDGANGWQQFIRITIPLISGTIFFTLIVNTIGSLQLFTEVYTMFFGNMSSGAASSAGLFYNVYLFRQAFEFLRMGYASAMAWLLFVIILILTFIQLRVSRRWVYYEGS